MSPHGDTTDPGRVLDFEAVSDDDVLQRMCTEIVGISLDSIAPARPGQNGGHERMHGDIAMEIGRNPGADRRRHVNQSDDGPIL